jgi:hypothetical protein
MINKNYKRINKIIFLFKQKSLIRKNCSEDLMKYYDKNPVGKQDIAILAGRLESKIRNYRFLLDVGQQVIYTA